MTPEQNTFTKKRRRSLLKILFSRTMIIAALLILNFALVFSFVFDVVQGLPVLFGSLVAFTAAMELIILNGRDAPSVKLTWCILVAVLPIFGSAMYFFVLFDLGNRVNRRLVAASVEGSLPCLPEDDALYRTIREEDKDFHNLALYLRRHAYAPVYTNTSVTYFPLGEDKFSALLQELEKAEHFIYLEYFLISRGHMWNSILEILERKAAQGLDVRLLYDGMNAFYNLPYSYPKELEKKGIRCKMHAPVRPFVSTHYNNRDHRKIAVIDGHTAFTGGINLEDCYINLGSPYGHWKDTAVMLRGDAVRSFTLMFLQMWNATERQQDFSPCRYVAEPAAAEGYVIPYGVSPTGGDHVGKTVYLHMLNQARDYAFIMTPYLILDSEMVNALVFAARRGVDVRLILPGIPDTKSAHILAKSHYRELAEAGVRIYEYTPGFVHAKVFLCDDLHAVVGTINLDYRSLYHHFECAAYLYRVPALADIRADFRETLAKCREITPADIRKMPLTTRISGALLKIVAPLM